jgi:hypothetical protein
MFACRDAAELFTDEREGKLEGWTRAKFRFHMTICAYCRRCRRQLHETIAITQELAHEEPLSKESEDRAMQAFRARRR